MLETDASSMLAPGYFSGVPCGLARSASCLLMFSGGRDSALAAVRLCKMGMSPALITIVAGHLVGINRVKTRLAELRPYLPPGSQWVLVKQPAELKTDTTFYDRTCLPCQHAYVVAAVGLAAKAEVKKVAFGYVSYQNHWPEQTPFAIARLQAVLRGHGMELLLPVQDLLSRESALQELKSLGLSVESLEQKCIRQVTNVTLSSEKLAEQVALWENAINQSILAMPHIDIEILEHQVIG